MSQSGIKQWIIDRWTVCFLLFGVFQRLISERDTLRETNDELRCAQVQQRCLSGAGEAVTHLVSPYDAGNDCVC